MRLSALLTIPRWLVAFALIALAFAGMPVFAEEATAVAGETAISSTVLLIIGAVSTIVGVVAGIFWSPLKAIVASFIERMQHAKASEAQLAAIEALGGGVTETYYEFTKAWKEDSKDGKLTEDEKKRLRDIAIEKGKKIATGPAFEVLKTTALPILYSWVEQIVLRRKTAA